MIAKRIELCSGLFKRPRVLQLVLLNKLINKKYFFQQYDPNRQNGE